MGEKIMFGGRYMGELVDSKIFVAPRKYRKHLYRGGLKTPAQAITKRMASWTADLNFLKYLRSAGVKVFVIHDTERNMLFWVSLKRFLEQGYTLEFVEGEQKHLAYHEWNDIESLGALTAAVRKAVV